MSNEETEPPCPACGHELVPWQDKTGSGWQCTKHDCLEMYVDGIDEVKR